jgi:hypothetical protein
METTQFLNLIHRCMLRSFLVVLLISGTGCVSIIRIDGPYEGQVVDAATNQPIEGAVVDGTWDKVEITPVSKMSKYYDNIEVLTDKDGEFKIPGKGLLIFSSIDTLILTICKVGYEQFPEKDRWDGLKQFGPFDEVSWTLNKAVFKIKRLSLEERRKRSMAMPDTPIKKYRLMRIEHNKENTDIGRPKNTIIQVE